MPRGVERALARHRQRYEAELERLLDAAIAVMRAQDTANPSVGDILAESGLSTTAFYRHFPTKDDLFVTLLQRAHERTLRRLEERMAASSGPSERIEAWVRAVLDLVRDDDTLTANRPFLLAHPRLLEQFPEEITAGFDALSAPLAADLVDGLGVLPDTASAMARLAMQHVFGVCIDRAALRRPIDDELVDAVVAYTSRAVLGTQAAVEVRQ
ncbi:MAG: TetR/AcrR family transcriptional regulator [Acidimicrobiales bacterium]|nr:TetR/AcrR family transcriptional regulator [Acidimicrobiales bacterium]